MRGTVLDFDPLRGQGLISGEDGNRYNFMGTQFNGNGGVPRAGSKVDFDTHETVAIDIYPVDGNYGGAGAVNSDKNKLVAALLAFFLGGLGIHKFYLGKTNAAVIMLLCGTIGWLLILPGIAIAIIAFIEFIIYLTKSDQEFYEQYVLGPKAWF
jgi:TM2 domain-containing membrane protein YozV